MKTISFLFMGLLVLIACTAPGQSAGTPTSAIAFPQPSVTEVKLLPTPSSLGDPVIWRDLQVNMDQAEITERFVTEFGSQRTPSAGQKFFWVHVTLRNVGKEEIAVPAAEHFSVLYAESELKPVYGHRAGYADYSDLGTTLFPGQKLDAWLRFDIPVAATLSELWFIFLPTSAQVGVSPSSPNYPYAENRPTYVWKCGL